MNDAYDGGTGLGPQVFSATNSVIAKVDTTRSVVRQVVVYPAFPVPTSLSRRTWRNFLDGIAAGAVTTENLLVSRAASCPNERIVLAGYSAGAMVMHRTVRWLSATGRTEILNRIAGAILIADGDRVVRDNHTRYGSAGELYGGVAVEMALSPTSKFSADMKARIHSICNARDVVCDFTSQLFNTTGLGIHTAYTNTQPLRDAASAVATSVMEWPILSPKSQSVTAEVGAPVEHVLTSANNQASSYRVSYRVPVPGKLPDGLTLSDQGWVTGSVATPQTVTVPIEVSHLTTGVYGQWVQGGSLTITISPAASPPPASETSLVIETTGVPEGTPLTVHSVKPCPLGTERVRFSVVTDVEPEPELLSANEVLTSSDGSWRFIDVPYVASTYGANPKLRVVCWGQQQEVLMTYPDQALSLSPPLHQHVTVSMADNGSVQANLSGDACPAPSDHMQLSLYLKNEVGNWLALKQNFRIPLRADGSWSPIIWDMGVHPDATSFGAAWACGVATPGSTTGGTGVYYWPQLRGSIS